MADTRKKVLFNDMEAAFEPKDAMSPYGLMSKWRVVPFESTAFNGKMIASMRGNAPDIYFDPKLEGWYKIFLYVNGTSDLALKLTSDPCYTHAGSIYRSPATLERMPWRCADMTGETIFLSKSCDGDPLNSFLSGIEFIPMSEEEVAEYKYEETRTDTKRIYATDDMHGEMFYHNMRTIEDWLGAVDNFRHSDVEWVSLEQVRSFISKRLPCDDPDDFQFPNYGDSIVQKTYPKFDYDEVLKACVARGHELGFKMSVSFRMGAWGMRYPYDQFYFDVDFTEEHPEFYVEDRNGDRIPIMSYAYTEVQDYVINEFLNMARSGCDAVTLIYHRGTPYAYFEKPVADRFYEMYGEYPYELPLDEPRLNALHCQIMTEFMRRARKALDDEFGKGKVEIHVRSFYSITDSKAMAVDTETWVKEGLVDAIITYPQRIFERLEGDIWKDEAKTRIDLEKYSNFLKTATLDHIAHYEESSCSTPYTNYRGELVGPADEETRIKEWVALEKQYGVKVYIEIMPRTLSAEDYRKRLIQIYGAGAERIGLWDTYGRVLAKSRWENIRKFGHKDEIATMPLDTETAYYGVRKFGKVYFDRFNPMWGS